MEKIFVVEFCLQTSFKLYGSSYHSFVIFLNLGNKMRKPSKVRFEDKVTGIKIPWVHHFKVLSVLSFGLSNLHDVPYFQERCQEHIRLNETPLILNGVLEQLIILLIQGSRPNQFAVAGLNRDTAWQYRSLVESTVLAIEKVLLGKVCFSTK